MLGKATRVQEGQLHTRSPFPRPRDASKVSGAKTEAARYHRMHLTTVSVRVIGLYFPTSLELGQHSAPLKIESQTGPFVHPGVRTSARTTSLLHLRRQLGRRQLYAAYGLFDVPWQPHSPPPRFRGPGACLPELTGSFVTPGPWCMGRGSNGRCWATARGPRGTAIQVLHQRARLSRNEQGRDHGYRGSVRGDSVLGFQQRRACMRNRVGVVKQAM